VAAGGVTVGLGALVGCASGVASPPQATTDNASITGIATRA
jgi:hypothetical protein